MGIAWFWRGPKCLPGWVGALITNNAMIWQNCSIQSENKVPQSARLTEGGGEGNCYSGNAQINLETISGWLPLPLETTYHQRQCTKGLNMLKFNKSYSHSSFRFVFFFCLQLYPYFGSSFVPLTPNIFLSKSKLLAFLSCLIAEILWSVRLSISLSLRAIGEGGQPGIYLLLGLIKIENASNVNLRPANTIKQISKNILQMF